MIEEALCSEKMFHLLGIRVHSRFEKAVPESCFNPVVLNLTLLYMAKKKKIYLNTPHSWIVIPADEK